MSKKKIGITSKIIYTDMNEEDFAKIIKDFDKKLDSFTEQIEKLNGLFKELNAQERFLLTDILIANIMNSSKLSQSVLISILYKYLYLTGMPNINIQQSNNKNKISYLG